MGANKLLVVEDDPGVQRQLRWSLDRYEVLFAEDRESALAQVRRHEPLVVLQDLGLPPEPAGVEEGMAALTDILAVAPHTKVIVVTGNGDEHSAVRAVGKGAYDFYQKPLDVDLLELIISRAFHVAELERQNRALQNRASGALDGLITASTRMQRVCRLVERVATTDATTLLLGETGSGKEVVARALHQNSGRSDARFVAINCAAIPENLLESELFGYEKGAYTGAHRQTKGKIELASGGTLFLDEIGDMPLPLQSKLLRFLQERSLERVGGRQEIEVDTRVICATHQNLAQLIEDGRFREDLYYRISAITIDIPPLRERDEDSVVLARAFLERAAANHRRPVRGFTEDALEAIRSYPWPGNIRELENKIDSAVILADDKLLTREDLGLPSDGGQTQTLNLRQVRDRAERDAIENALAVAGENISKAADLLGVSRPTLYDLMKKHGVKD